MEGYCAGEKEVLDTVNKWVRLFPFSFLLCTFMMVVIVFRLNHQICTKCHYIQYFQEVHSIQNKCHLKTCCENIDSRFLPRLL